MRHALPLLLALATIRCATVAHGRYQTLPVESNPSGAAVRVDCGGLGSNAGVTPVNVELWRKSENCSVTVSKEGYEPQTVQLRRVHSAFVFGNVLPGAVTGAATSVGTGVVAILADESDAVIGTAFTVGFLIGAAVPPLIDHATGGMYKHVPERISVTLSRSP